MIDSKHFKLSPCAMKHSAAACSGIKQCGEFILLEVDSP